MRIRTSGTCGGLRTQSTSLHNPFFSPLLYYPDGIDLFWQPIGFSQGILALPITLAFGPLPHSIGWCLPVLL